MRKLRQIVRLKLEAKLAGRAIARSCGVSPGTMSAYLDRIARAKLSWPLPPELDDDAALTRLLFPNEGCAVQGRPEADWAHVHKELRRKHVTKQLLWHEYREAHPDGYEYSRFCELYARWAAHLSVTMRQIHVAGEKTFVDFSGDGIDVVDPVTGECRSAKLFVAVLGGSSLTYVEPVFSEDLATWIGCHIRAFEYFGGVSAIWVPDNLKSGVTRPDNYDPEINPTYAELAEHYGAVVIPARKRRPRDKAKVEQAVLLAERWILAVLRNRTFFSLAELHAAVKPLVERLNDRLMKKLGKSRRQLFDEVERGALRPLPARLFELAVWSKPRVQVNYHVDFEGHSYSVPYQLVGQQLDVRATETAVEILRGGKRVASHARSFEKFKYTTEPAHMPRGHREYAEWTPARLVAWAKHAGPATAALVEEIMGKRRHPEHGFKPCLGIMRLREKYGDERVERACARALSRRACSYQSVKAILQHNLDAAEDLAQEAQGTLPLHENVRGAGYYH
jgi:transposase